MLSELKIWVPALVKFQAALRAVSTKKPEAPTQSVESESVGQPGMVLPSLSNYFGVSDFPGYQNMAGDPPTG